MPSIATDFPTSPEIRSRADRLTDGVVAGYIRALAQTAAPRERSQADEDGAGAVPVLPGRLSSHRRGRLREHADRVGCALQARRALEA